MVTYTYTHGFIKPNDMGNNVFMHISRIKSHKTAMPYITRGTAVAYQSSFDSVKKSETAYNVVVLETTDGECGWARTPKYRDSHPSSQKTTTAVPLQQVYNLLHCIAFPHFL